jgi:flavin-dependent dehydrogenase
MHFWTLKNYGHIRKAVGPAVAVERMQAAPLRLGGIQRSFGDHFLIIGDAAGHIDPLTGEGIHYAIEGAAIAAGVLEEALRTGDLSARFLSRYHQRWMRSFGRDFRWSRMMARVCVQYPKLLDGTVALLRRRGADSLRDWGEVMTGARPKSAFLHPRLALPILREVALQWR